MLFEIRVKPIVLTGVIFCDIFASKDLSIDFSQAIVEYLIMAVRAEALGHAPQTEVSPPVVIRGNVEQNQRVVFDPTRDNVESPFFFLHAEEPLSAGMLRLAEIVGPMRWNALMVQTKSDLTPQERADFVSGLLATPVSDERPISEWSKHDWRVSRHHTDRAFTWVDETVYRPGDMRREQAGFARSLNRFIHGFPEGEGDMRELFQAIFELGTSGDWEEEKPNLARELSNAYWDVGERVLESWTAQPPRALPAAA